MRPLLTLLVLFVAISTAADCREVKWLTDPAKARAEMEQSGRPGLLYFYNLRARPCHEMQTETFVDPSVTEAMGEFVCVALHQPDHMELFKDRHELFKVPAVVFVNADGSELDKAIGLKSAPDFSLYLSRILMAQGLTGAEQDQALEGAALDVTASREGTSPVEVGIIAPRARNVALVGDFNDWRLDETMLERNASGQWTETIYLPRGAHEYMFYIDGQYVRDPSNQLTRVSPMGTINSVAIVGNPLVSPIVNGRNVTFVLYNAEASSVQVAGTFNNWQHFTMFRNPDSPGMWGVVYEGLPPGLYEYKYLIDGEWQNDPENYYARFDPDGNPNNSFVIGE